MLCVPYFVHTSEHDPLRQVTVLTFDNEEKYI